MQEAFSRADHFDGRLGSFAERFDETALAAAARADAELASGRDRGALHGIPFSQKHVLAPDSVATRRLLEAGAVLLGTTTAPAFALSSWRHPTPRNPWDLNRAPGGSSAGSATGVAAGFFFASLASDTGGSIRSPAAFNGVTALKPTFGLVPRTGVTLLASSCDAVGPIAGTARELWHWLAAVAGADEADPASHGAPPLGTLAFADGDLRGVRIGADWLSRFPEPARHPELHAHFEQALAVLRDAGAEIIELQIPLYRELAIARILTFAVEAAAAHQHLSRRGLADLEPSTRRLVVLGSSYSGADYVRAQRLRRHGQRVLESLWSRVSYVVTPTTPGPAPELAAPDELGLHSRTDPRALNGFSGIWNALGNPALALPIGLTRDGLPLGLQLIGRAFDDAGVLGVAAAFQGRTEWHRVRPRLEETVAAAPASTAREAQEAPETSSTKSSPNTGEVRWLLGELGEKISDRDIDELAEILPLRREQASVLRTVDGALTEAFVPSLPS